MKTLTKDDIGTLFHIAPRTVELWVQLGKLPKPTKVGRRALWQAAEIEKIIGETAPIATEVCNG